MRCKHCGSKMIFPDTNHQQFSAGKAVAGAVLFGLVGTAAGFIGKDVKGYRCSCCGMFSEDTLSVAEETRIDMAVREAKNQGKSVSYERFREKYLGIEQIPTVGYGIHQDETPTAYRSFDDSDDPLQLPSAEAPEDPVKNAIPLRQYIQGCPVLIKKAVIRENASTNMLQLTARNVSDKTLRSVYLQVQVFDDAGDLVSVRSFAYQGLSVMSGEYLPSDKMFDLQTEIAYKVTVVCEKAAFVDDSVWRKPEDAVTFTLPETNRITPLNFPLHKYLQELVSEKSRLAKDVPLYHPVYENDCGICICGAPSYTAEPCPVCGLSPVQVAELLDYDNLILCRRSIIKNNAIAGTRELSTLFESAQDARYREAEEEEKKKTIRAYTNAAQIFASLSGYKDADARHQGCLDAIACLEKKITYNNAVALMSKKPRQIQHFQNAIAEFNKIPDWEDSKERIAQCEEGIAEIEREIEEENRRIERVAKEMLAREKRTRITVISICAAICLCLVYFLFLAPLMKYNKAVTLREEGNYAQAAELFVDIYSFNDSKDQLLSTIAQAADDRESLVQTLAAVPDNILLSHPEQVYDCIAALISHHEFELASKYLDAFSYTNTTSNYKAYLSASQALYEKRWDIAIFEFGYLDQFLDAPEQLIAAYRGKLADTSLVSCGYAITLLQKIPDKTPEEEALLASCQAIEDYGTVYTFQKTTYKKNSKYGKASIYFTFFVSENTLIARPHYSGYDCSDAVVQENVDGYLYYFKSESNNMEFWISKTELKIEMDSPSGRVNVFFKKT